MPSTTMTYARRVAARVRRAWAEMDYAQRCLFELGIGLVAHDDLGRVGPPGQGRSRDAVAAQQLAHLSRPSREVVYPLGRELGIPLVASRRSWSARRGASVGGCSGRVRTSASNEDFPKWSTIDSSFASTFRRAMLFRLQHLAGVPGLT